MLDLLKILLMKREGLSIFTWTLSFVNDVRNSSGKSEEVIGNRSWFVKFDKLI